MIARIEKLMEHDTAGDPMTGLKWTRRTTAKIAAELDTVGIKVSDRTVARLLKQMGYSLRVNHKKIAVSASPELRDAQFHVISQLRERFAAERLPLISVDTKKKELVGRFKNPGAAWSRQAEFVNDHDFRSEALGIVIPYGVFEPQANCGTVFLGTTFETPDFAVDCIEKWWRTEGRKRHPTASHLAILADAGGSNRPNSRVWKYGLQTRVCDRHGISVTVAHYPTGASKWNPIEHRLFSEISKNWAGRPLDSHETILNYLRTTTTNTGLRVRAHLVQRNYRKGVAINADQMKRLRITDHPDIPKWNYTLRPA